MKKKLVFLFILIFLALLAVTVYLCISFFGLYAETQQTEPTQMSSTRSVSEAEAFVTERWHFDAAEYEETTATMTAIKFYDMTYSQACKVGETVFVEELAPNSYLSQALTLAADLTSQFSVPNLQVVISYRSSDGQEIFRVDSSGQVWVCWDSDK